MLEIGRNGSSRVVVDGSLDVGEPNMDRLTSRLLWLFGLGGESHGGDTDSEMREWILRQATPWSHPWVECAIGDSRVVDVRNIPSLSLVDIQRLSNWSVLPKRFWISVVPSWSRVSGYVCVDNGSLVWVNAGRDVGLVLSRGFEGGMRGEAQRGAIVVELGAEPCVNGFDSDRWCELGNELSIPSYGVEAMDEACERAGWPVHDCLPSDDLPPLCSEEWAWWSGESQILFMAEYAAKRCCGGIPVRKILCGLGVAEGDPDHVDRGWDVA